MVAMEQEHVRDACLDRLSDGLNRIELRRIWREEDEVYARGSATACPLPRCQTQEPRPEVLGNGHFLHT